MHLYSILVYVFRSDIICLYCSTFDIVYDITVTLIKLCSILFYTIMAIMTPQCLLLNNNDIMSVDLFKSHTTSTES